MGGASSLIFLGRYEQSINWAKEAFESAERLQSSHDITKALEIEALAYFYIGDYEASQRILQMRSRGRKGKASVK